jgi:hypothetical protein
MAKKSKSKTAAPPPTPAAKLSINPFGPTQQRKIKRSKVVSSEYLLDDGSKIRVTPMVADVRRAIKQYNEKGEPLYFLTIGQAIVTKAPAKLLKKQPKSKKKKGP